jgi:predicted GNAT family N-acyltransferase
VYDLTELRGRVMIAEAKVKRLEVANKDLTNQLQCMILKEHIDAK